MTSGGKRLFITGATGLLGSAVVDRWASRWEVTALVGRSRLATSGVANVPGDLREPSTLRQLVAMARPDVVLHCAAWTDLDACEENPLVARTIHRDATAALAEGAADVQAKFVYISTDSVFSGVPGPHREGDPVDPRSVYAKTKLEGEEVALSACPSGLVVRTSIVGWNAQSKVSLTEWILRELRAGRAINAFSDVSFTPIGTTALAVALERLIQTEVRGIFHVGGGECITKYDFARKVACEFDLPDALVVRGSIEGAKLRAPRPLAPCLDSSRFAALTGDNLPTVQETLREMRRLEANGWRERLRASVLA